MAKYSVWMLEGSYGVIVRPRSRIEHLSLDDEYLLCGRQLDKSGYECVDVTDEVQEITMSFPAGRYVCYYRLCRNCHRKALACAAKSDTESEE